MYIQAKKLAAQWYGLTFVLISSTLSLQAWVPDNRYIPLYTRPRIAPDNTPSLFEVDAMVATGNKAYNDMENEIGIPELYGNFDLGKLGEAFTVTGRTNPLPSFLQGISLPYTVEGKIQMQGFAFTYYQQILDWFAVGASWLAMRVNTHQNFFLKQQDIALPLTGSLALELDDIRRQMFTELGFTQNHAGQVNVGDFEFFVRLGYKWHYILKCRSIDVGLRIGALMPSGARQDIFAPSTIPFGGNGQWGWYLAGDGLFELKEDIKVGLLLQITKRVARTQMLRLPVLNEPQIFGATTGQVHLNQGATLTFSPYFILENLRKGLGVGLQYTLTKHQEDSWHVLCTENNIPGRVKQVQALSEWGSDYFTLNVFYDFGKEKPKRSFDPIILFYWDIPAMLFVTKNSVKTNKVSLGIGFSF